MPTEKFTLVVPLDASGVKDLTPDQAIKMVVQLKDGSSLEQLVKFSAEGKGEVSFSFKEVPATLRIALGPAEATAEEVLKMDTIHLDVPSRLWLHQTRVVLHPIRIAPYYWNWWRVWCRTFTIHGKVICADGRPVIGATVNAFDVDWWFWWTSRQFVGSAITDENGAFEIEFRWCCVFWPPWWWLHRVWEIDPWLIKRIKPVLDRSPSFVLGRVTNQPSLGVFERLLEGEGEILKRPLAPKDVDVLDKVRERLLQKLPAAPELEKLQIWPWYPWWPWRDCVPDIIFKVTQDTLTPGTVILDEQIWDARWNIPNPLNVTLMANDKAWCKPDHIDGERCMVFTEVCDRPFDDIGGNLGAPAEPAGYLSPGGTVVGSTGYSGDRPFAGSVVVKKIPDDMPDVDYYGIEYVNEIDRVQCNAPYQPLPAHWAMDFYRHWMEILPGPPLVVHTGNVWFNWQFIDGHWVVESREHSEATGGLGGWDSSRWWLYNRDVVMFLDSSKFPDGAYRFRIVSYKSGPNNTLVDEKVLPYCNSTDDASLVLAFDNRLNPDPAHPTSPTHECTPIHLCVTEPDTDFISITIGGHEVGPCQVVNRDTEANLEIVFRVTDPLFTRIPCDQKPAETTGAHLAYYKLTATYGESLEQNLLQNATSVVAVSPGAYTGWQPGDELGTYGRALGQMPANEAPHWAGGIYKVTIPVGKAFPEPCCYQLNLVAYKRTVVGCDAGFYIAANGNESTYTLGVGICG